MYAYEILILLGWPVLIVVSWLLSKWAIKKFEAKKS
jgi:hypothetical protein